MSGKHATIIFVPHARAKFRKLRVSHRILQSVVGLVTVSLFLSTFFTVQYFTSLSRTHELSKLQQENRDLQVANEQFSRSVESLRGQLKTVEERTRKLSIIAGISPTDEGATGGVGGLRNEGVATTKVGDQIDTMSFRSRKLTSQLAILEEKLSERSQALASTPSIAPVRGILTDGFGGRSDPFTGEKGMHMALDISSAHGQPILAPADGIVVKAEWANGYGHVIFLSHGLGYSSRYGHLSSFNVKPGQKVSRGDVIGYVGSTGRSTGPHLHYEVRLNGRPVNPLAYILNAF
jgi:murein DD-endopeptidase MepM/ murein hydrolase activator NlpD